MNNSNLWDCKICNKCFDNYRSLSSHLKWHSLKSKEYYDIYYKEDGEGRCKRCRNQTRYYALNKGYADFCSKTCINKCRITREKIESTCREKYGFDSPCQNKEIRQKMEDTSMKKYGVANPSSSKEIRDKIKDTTAKKYGVDNVFKLKEFQDKIKNTNLEKYGFESATKNDVVKEKTKNTNLLKYGVEYLLQNEQLAKLMHDNVFKKYGVDNVFQSDVVKEKIKATNLRKYGVEYPMQSEEIRNRAFLMEEHSYKLKKYILKNGDAILYQSKLELKFIKKCEKDNVYIKNGDVIDYLHENKNKKYHIDFKILEDNQWRLIEIKGLTRWFRRDLNNGILKAKSEAAVKYSKKHKYLDYQIILNGIIWDYKKYLGIDI